MKKDIRDMIRQRQVTGEKVGQAMIRDLVTLYQLQRDSQDFSTQPLTESEKAQLVAALDSPEQVAVYSQYKFVISYLQQVLTHHTAAWQDVEINFLKIYSALLPLDDAEQLLGVIQRFPELCEQEAFEAAIAEELVRRQHSQITGSQLMAGMCLWLLLHPAHPLYQTARRAVTGESIQPREPMPFLEALAEREPAFCEELAQMLSEIPGFQAEDLNAGVAYAEIESRYPGLYEGLFGTAERARFPHGYAIPRCGAAPVDPMETEGIGVIPLLDRLAGQLSQVYRNFLSACRHTLAVETAVELLSERIDVPELKGYLQHANLEDRLAQVRQMFDRLHILPQRLSPSQRDALEQRVNSLFPDITLDELRPTEQARQRARKALVELSVLERATTLHTLLTGEGGGQDAP